MTVPELRSDIQQKLLRQIQAQLNRKPTSQQIVDLQNEANMLRTLIRAYGTFMAIKPRES